MEVPETRVEQFGEIEVPIEVGGMFDRYRMRPDLDAIARLPGVGDVSFFRNVEKSPAAFRDFEFLMPCFYYDLGYVQAVFSADVAALRRLLPTDALVPATVRPGRGLLAMTAFEYRVTDIDPYNEFAISVITRPVGSRLPGPLATLWGQLRRTSWAFVWQLPVTTELAWYGGKVGYNYPKYVTELPWRREGDAVIAEILEEEASQVRIAVKVLPTRPGKDLLNHGMAFQDGAVIDVPIRVRPRARGRSYRARDVRLEIGAGPIADVLRTLEIGSALMVDYVPSAQLILPAGRRIG